MITEHLMRPGSGDVRFVPDVPISITDEIRALVDENASGVGASLVITPVRVDPSQIGDAATLASAIYTGPIVGRESRLSLQVTGLSAWLDSYLDAAVSRSAGTPAQWVGDLLANGLTAGTITGGSNVSRTFPAHSVSHREALDAWAALAGVEYRVNPDLTVDAAAAATLFTSPPLVVVTRREEGPDGELRGVEGSMLDQALKQLGPNIATKAVALGEGAGASIAKGTATRSVSLLTPAGGTPSIVTVLSAPSEESANADTLASNFLNLQGMRRQVNVNSRTYGLPRFVRPGDEVWLWDPTSGLIDTSNQAQFRGETIYPALVRLLSYTWPLEVGMGVFVRPNAATPTYIDVTDWVEWEDGSDTWWTVGDWSPPSYGPTNRTAPEIEERVAGDGAGPIAWTPTITQSGTVAGTTNYGWYVKRPDGSFMGQVRWTASAAGTAGSPITVSLPVTAADVSGVGGSALYDDAGTIRAGTVYGASSSAFVVYVDGATGSAAMGASPSFAIASGDVLIATVHGRWY